MTWVFLGRTPVLRVSPNIEIELVATTEESNDHFAFQESQVLPQTVAGSRNEGEKRKWFGMCDAAAAAAVVVVEEKTVGIKLQWLRPPLWVQMNALNVDHHRTTSG